MSASYSDEDRGRLSRSTQLAFLLLIASLGFIQLPVSVGGHGLVITDFVFLVVAGLLVVVLLLLHGTRIQWNSFYFLLIFYLATLILSCFFSGDQRTSFFRLPEEMYLLGLCILTIDLVQNANQLKHAILAWLVGSAFAVSLGLVTILIFYVSPGNSLLEYLTYHYGAVPVGHYPRITATFVSASMFCNYLNVAFVLALVARSEQWIDRWVSWLLVAAILICVLFTISVGLGGVSLAFGLWFWLKANQRNSIPTRLAILAGVIGAVVFVLISLFALEPYPSAVSIGSIPFTDIQLIPSSRVLVWNEAFGNFLRNVFAGRGLGMPVANILFVNTDGSLSLLTDAHNSFLSVAAQNGIMGLTAIILIVVSLTRRWIRHARNRTTSIAVGLGLAFFCSFVYQGITGSYEEARHLWVLMGLFIAADKIESKQDQNS